jgi:hypothetical protein
MLRQMARVSSQESIADLMGDVSRAIVKADAATR